MNKLRQMVREEINKIVKESNKEVSVSHADKFIREVLKLGTRDNLFDKFMKKEGISQNELSSLVKMVSNRIQEKWT